MKQTTGTLNFVQYKQSDVGYGPTPVEPLDIFGKLER